ncbi:MAG TPA: biotin--[acetyl-CoA-carboxylase] ligase [Elusimicrobiota bacterium]|nr:biotin--[acetyl-CoA-carboxylase] ligase [Elusimicrobiota bacterium]
MTVLRNARGRYVSGSRLAAGLCLTRAAIHKQVVRLREWGYDITGTNRKGYRLENSPQALDTDRFRAASLGRPICHFPSLGSTQDELKERALAGAPQGTLVLADEQTSGRGRMGRRWLSPRGGLWFSLLLRPAIPPAQVPALALVAALDWAMVLRRATGLPACVKWPNDVWIDNRKVAGILTEMSSEMDRVHWVVLGVGVNINNPSPRGMTPPAASLREMTGKPFYRQALLEDWLKRFAGSLRRYQRDGFSAFRRDCEECLSMKGRTVVCETAQGTVAGRVEGIDGEGRLLLRTAAGLRRFGEGAIRLKKGDERA